MYSDAIYSHYEYVKARLAQYQYQLTGVNGTPVPVQYTTAGLLAAQDWPPKIVKFQAFYLLEVKDTPVGKQAYSAANPIKLHKVQWSWVIKGSDLQTGQRGAYRGDRFVIHQQMKDALTGALYPGFCEKKTGWAMDANGVFQSKSLVPQEFITWVPVEHQTNPKQEAGIVYGVAPLSIANMLDQITA